MEDIKTIVFNSRGIEWTVIDYDEETQEIVIQHDSLMGHCNRRFTTSLYNILETSMRCPMCNKDTIQNMIQSLNITLGSDISDAVSYLDKGNLAILNLDEDSTIYICDSSSYGKNYSSIDHPVGEYLEKFYDPKTDILIDVYWLGFEQAFSNLLKIIIGEEDN